MIYNCSRFFAAIGNRRGLRIAALIAGTGLAGIAAAFVTGHVSGNREAAVNLLSSARPVDSRIGPIGMGVGSRSVPRTAAERVKVETEIITLRPEGFEPSSITRPQGTFFLLLDNRTGLAGIQINLDGEAGSPMRQVNIPRENSDWSDGLDLPPGVYLVTEAAHPEWSCKITITPK